MNWLWKLQVSNRLVTIGEFTVLGESEKPPNLGNLLMDFGNAEKGGVGNL